MKVRLSMSMATACFVLSILTATNNVFAQRSVSNSSPQDPGMMAISANTLTVRGMKFPRLRTPQAAGKTDGLSCCNVGDVRNHDVIWATYRTPGVKPRGKITHQRTDTYSPPSKCWVISKYRLTIFSERGSSSSLSAAPGGYTFVTSTQYQQTFEDLKTYVLNMNILDKYKIEIIANLKDFTNNYAAYSQSFSVSHGSVMLYTELTSEGRYNGDSWFTGIVHATEDCCPLEIQDPVALKTALTNWINETVNALPRKFDPHTSTERLGPKRNSPNR